MAKAELVSDIVAREAARSPLGVALREACSSSLNGRDPNRRLITVADLQQFDARQFHGNPPIYILNPETGQVERASLAFMRVFLNGEEQPNGTYIADGDLGFIVRFSRDGEGRTRRARERLELLTGDVEVRYDFRPRGD
jgi:hypothetical protein